MMELPTMYHKIEKHNRRIVRETYIELQDGNCWYCGYDIHAVPPQWIQDKSINMTLFPEGFLDYPIHLQHDHKTGLTEGAVHARCNAVLWQYEGR